MSRNKVFFYSDPHFFHEEIIKYCKRPFDNEIRMNEELIKRYNYLVNDNDLVYFLGDVGFSHYDKLAPIFKQLKGRKILIRGNHDKASRGFYLSLGFFDVLNSANISLGKTKVNLQHYPNRTFLETLEVMKCYLFNDERNRSFKPKWNRCIKELKRYREFKHKNNNWTVCGHVHERWKVRKKNINCSVDQWKFRPVSADEILNIIRKKEKK